MKKLMLVIALAGFAIAQVNAQTAPAKSEAPAKKETSAPAHKSAKSTHQVKKDEKATTTTKPAAAPAKAVPAKAVPAKAAGTK